MKKALKPVHLIHLLLYSPTSAENNPVPIFGRTRLMKMIFIFEKELSKHFQNEKKTLDFDFEAYNYGPYSKKVYEAVDFLETREIIESKPVSSLQMDLEEMEVDHILTASEAEILTFVEVDTFRSESFHLTDLGITMMEDLSLWFAWPNLTEKQHKVLMDFKTTMVNTPLKSILKYVYSKYPKYAEKSIIYKTLFPNGVS